MADHNTFLTHCWKKGSWSMSINKCFLLYAVGHNNGLWFYSGGNSTYIDLCLIIYPFIHLPLKSNSNRLAKYENAVINNPLCHSKLAFIFLLWNTRTERYFFNKISNKYIQWKGVFKISFFFTEDISAYMFKNNLRQSKWWHFFYFPLKG